jgi:hypothetical protein
MKMIYVEFRMKHGEPYPTELVKAELAKMYEDKQDREIVVSWPSLWERFVEWIR